MKFLRVVLGVAGIGLSAGCYSVEQANVERGFRWIRRGETEKALTTFNHTLRKYPESVPGHAGLGDALSQSRRQRDAIDAYSRALALRAVAKPESVTRGSTEVVGKSLRSYQNQGLHFPFGLEAYLHLRRGMAYHELATTRGGADHSLFRFAAADDDEALRLSPAYTAAMEARDRLRKEMPASPPP